MRAGAVPVLDIFDRKMQLEVPLFQRQYVWSKDRHWEPLWEDISRKFTEALEGRKDAPVHFLGAMVLDQKLTQTTHVGKRQVIDGQQRLTTLQIFLSVLRDFCRASGHADLADECREYTFNRVMGKGEGEADRFKVWPTQSDRTQFAVVVGSEARQVIEEKYPLIRRKHSRYFEPRPQMVEAYIFFYDSIADYFSKTEENGGIATSRPLDDRLTTCFLTMKSALQVVVIDLEDGDDAQVIFETLNARGEPLLPADLLRNYIFLRAARAGEAYEDLYNQHWRKFDEPFWRHEVKQGRLMRPRSDLFLQHFLASRQAIDVPIKHLFVEYRVWIERQRPFATVRDELTALARQGDHFRRILEPKQDDPLAGLARFLSAFEISTVYPLLLALFEARYDAGAWQRISTALESYLLRRAVCNLTTKGYNRIFLQLVKNLQGTDNSPETVIRLLKNMTGETGMWPSDEEFERAWMGIHAYQTLNNPKLVFILSRLNATFMTTKTEDLVIKGNLTIEHLMPQSWAAAWPLPDGSICPSWQVRQAEPGSPSAMAASRRDAMVQRIGNLTILTSALNSSVSNGPWGGQEGKRNAIIMNSLLPINKALINAEKWDEAAIEARSRDLLTRALQLWPKPDNPKSSGTMRVNTQPFKQDEIP